MAFLDELGKVISDKSKEAAEKVKDLTGVIQLKTKLSAEKEKVNRAYVNLGKAYYDRHDAAAEDDYAEDFELIRAGLMKMAELEDQITELEGSRVCAECGAKVEKAAQFCSKCGALMPEKHVCQETDESVVETEESAETVFHTAEKADFAGNDSKDEE